MEKHKINLNVSQSQANSFNGDAIASSVSGSNNQVNNQSGKQNRNNSIQGDNNKNKNEEIGLLESAKTLPANQIKRLFIALFIVSTLVLIAPELIGIVGVFASIAGLLLAYKGKISS